METIQIGSCQFTDNESGESSYMVVRVVDSSIGLGLSLETDGDIEIFLDTNRCELLIKWLSTALDKANNINGQGIEGKEFRGE